VYGYLGAIFTRSLFFPIATVLAAWLLIAADDAYPFAAMMMHDEASIRAFIVDAFWAIPATTVIVSIVAILVVKVLDLGQPIDVWLTGSGGGSTPERVKHEEYNIPFVVSAIVVLFVGIFFVHAAADMAIAYGDILVDHGLSVAVAIVALVAFVVLLGASGWQYMQGTRFNDSHDLMSIYYTVVLGVLVLVEYALLAATSLAAGWHIVASVAAALVLILIGVWFESRRANSAEGDKYRGRFYAFESNGLLTAIRVVAVVAGYGTLVGLGHVARAASSRPRDMLRLTFFWPLVIAIAVLVAVYVVILLVKNNKSRSSSTSTVLERSAPGIAADITELGEAAQPMLRLEPRAPSSRVLRSSAIESAFVLPPSGEPRRRRTPGNASLRLEF
jgi:hypothetical protein